MLQNETGMRLFVLLLLLQLLLLLLISLSSCLFIIACEVHCSSVFLSQALT